MPLLSGLAEWTSGLATPGQMLEVPIPLALETWQYVESLTLNEAMPVSIAGQLVKLVEEVFSFPDQCPLIIDQILGCVCGHLCGLFPDPPQTLRSDTGL